MRQLIVDIVDIAEEPGRQANAGKGLCPCIKPVSGSNPAAW